MPPSVQNRLRVRPATPDDVEAIAAIHVEGYEDAYRDLIPAAVMEARPLELRIRVWRERLGAMTERELVLVAELDGEVAGFSSGRAATDAEGGDGGASIGCWENLYLKPAVLGGADSLRAGLALHEGTVDGLAAAGFTEAVNFVIEGNDRAKRFFEALGWRPDGGIRITEDVVHHRHRRPIP